MTSGASTFADPFDAGPYTRAQEALRLSRPGAPNVIRRALLAAALAWIPLVVLAAVEGVAVGPTPRESLLLDLGAYARYLIALPVLVLAEAMCLPRLSNVGVQFEAGGLIAEADRGRYAELITSTRRLLGNHWVEVVLVIATYALALGLAESRYPAHVSSWVAPIREGTRTTSLAGWWRLAVSQPLLLLLVMGWIWRIALWWRFMWRVSRLDLRLVPSHPDHAGGLFFVSTALPAFGAVTFGVGVMIAGALAQAIVVDAQPPTNLQYTIGGFVLIVLLLIVGPMVLLVGSLYRARIDGLMRYGTLAASLGGRFEERWLAPGKRADTDALSAPDFSATTDLYSIAANVTAMRLLPVDLWSVLLLVVATVAPFVPIAFIVLPIDELLAFMGRLVL